MNKKITPLFLVQGLFPAYWAGAEGFDPEAIEEPFAYILDASGWKIYKMNGVSTAVIKVDSVQGLPTLEQKVDFRARKIPLDLIQKVTAWFKAVYQKYRSEAVGYLYYRPSTGEWQFVPPTQTATGASASYEAAPKKEGWQIVGTIHSHGSMSAFHSGTDDADEEFFDGVHITVGRVESVPEYSCSIVVQGHREVVDPATIINGMAPLDAVPGEWLAAVKAPATTGLDPLFQARADKLYAAYYAGKISEAQYQRDLRKLEAEEKAHRAAEAKRLAKSRRKTVGAGAGYSSYHRFGDEEEFDGYGFPSESASKKSRKGGRHGKKW